MKVLAFDTASPHCAAALWHDGAIVADVLEPMARGQVEHLMPLLQDMMTHDGTTFEEVGAIGVGVGPGNFTGVRISVSAARGLALALGIPAIGVTRFDALSLRTEIPCLGCITAPRNMVYVQGLGGAKMFLEPELIELTRAETCGMPLLFEKDESNPARDIALIAARSAQTHDPAQRPAPLYIKAPDAAPSKIKAPRIIS